MGIFAGIVFLIYLILGGIFMVSGSLILGGYLVIASFVMALFAIGLFILGRFRLVPIVRWISIGVSVLFILALIASIVGAFVVYSFADSVFNEFGSSLVTEFGSGAEIDYITLIFELIKLFMSM